MRNPESLLDARLSTLPLVSRDPESLLDARLSALLSAPRDQIDLQLERPRAVWQALGHPTTGNRVVLVGGTNGKGSCVEALCSLARAAGLRVGSYASPHLRSLCERVVLPEGPVSAEDFLQALDNVEKASPVAADLTWFECITLAAFDILARADLDLAVLEIGLGGRLDVVNLQEPDIAIVSGVALDHCEFLGNTLEEIATDKSHIYRPGKPALCGQLNAPLPLRGHALELGSIPCFAGHEYDFREHESGFDLYCPMAGLDLKSVSAPNLPARSAALAMIAARILVPELPVSLCTSVIEKVKVPGRMQLWQHQGVRVLLDVAHNVEAIERLKRSLASLRAPVEVIFGAMSNKDVATMVRELAPEVGTWHLCASELERSAKPEDIRAWLPAPAQQQVQCHESAEQAVLSALGRAKELGRDVLVCGSFVTVGAVMDALDIPADYSRHCTDAARESSLSSLSDLSSVKHA